MHRFTRFSCWSIFINSHVLCVPTLPNLLPKMHLLYAFARDKSTCTNTCSPLRLFPCTHMSLCASSLCHWNPLKPCLPTCTHPTFARMHRACTSGLMMWRCLQQAAADSQRCGRTKTGRHACAKTVQTRPAGQAWWVVQGALPATAATAATAAAVVVTGMMVVVVVVVVVGTYLSPRGPYFLY